MKINSAYLAATVTLILGIVLISCSKDEGMTQSSDNRSFYMGVTPWPSDLSIEEVNKTYAFINNHCDIVAHHFNEGIPYEEFHRNLPLPKALVDDVAFRKSKVKTSQSIFLSVSALAISRKEKDIYYKNSTMSDNLKEQWIKLPFDDPKIVDAYAKYMLWLIKEFQPIYVNYGVESNLNNWDEKGFKEYKSFLALVYARLKASHPSLPIFISFMVGENAAGYNKARQLLPYTDFIALSAYPYTLNMPNQGSDPNNIPDDFFEKFIQLDTSKPLAIAETGYIAQDLQINEFNLKIKGTENWQKSYLDKMLRLCKKHEARFFIWFTAKDYDRLIETVKGQGLSQDILSLMTLWRDTGLIDEQGKSRPSFHLWREWMDKSKY
jgi:hypothetical protein